MSLPIPMPMPLMIPVIRLDHVAVVELAAAGVAPVREVARERLSGEPLLRAEQKCTELNRARVDFYTNLPSALAGPHCLFLFRFTAGTDRALLESTPSRPDGLIGYCG